jgi:hypothetical protein
MFLKQLKLHLGSTRFSNPRHILRIKKYFEKLPNKYWTEDRKL